MSESNDSQSPVLGEEIGRGGQAIIFLVKDGIESPKAAVFKQYKQHIEPRRDGFSALMALYEHLGKSEQHWIDEHAAWPSKLSLDGEKVIGCFMPLIPDGYFVLDGERRRSLSFQHLHTDFKETTRWVPKINNRIRVKLIEDFLKTVTLLHECGVVLGDISADNCLWTESDLQGRPSVFFVDCDSMRVQGSVAPIDQGDPPGWALPEARNDGSHFSGQRSRHDDEYKVGLFVLRTLFAKTELHDVWNLARDIDAIKEVLVDANQHEPLPARLLGRSEKISDLFVRSQESHLARPSAAEWLSVFQGERIMKPVTRRT